MAACEIHLVSFLKPKTMTIPRSMASAFFGWAPGLLHFRVTWVIAAVNSHAKNPKLESQLHSELSVKTYRSCRYSSRFGICVSMLPILV